jgi:hypothetical protein
MTNKDLRYVGWTTTGAGGCMKVRMRLIAKTVTADSSKIAE